MKPGKIIKWIFIVLLLAFFIFLLARIFMQGRHEVLTGISPTENAVSAYSDDGESAFSTVDFKSEISADGYFSVYSPVYCEKTGELQLTSRYNDSLFGYLGVPEGTAFSWELRDADGNTLSVGEAVGSEKSYIYNYTRLVFDGVTIDGDTDIYLYLICGECGYPTEKTEGFPIHESLQPIKEYKLTKAEKEMLSAIDK